MKIQSPRPSPDIDPLRAQHLDLVSRDVVTDQGRVAVIVDANESPLAWLATRRGRDGHPLIASHQYQAGERLRADFTRAHLMPRTTTNWENPLPGERRGGTQTEHFTDVMIASRQRVGNALESVGPEFSGLLLDVCCFLKGLVDVERERGWPARSAKVVLQLGLDRLARHYGLAAAASGEPPPRVRTWLAPDAAFSVEI